MKNRLSVWLWASFSSPFFLQSRPVGGPVGVDDKIKVLEQELGQLKAEQARANQEQIELKKEATAAAAALPTFTYRPGRGVTIAAADRAWSMETNYELMVVMYNHMDGNDRRGATTGALDF